MRILYAIQGTGNGHLSRARDVIPILKKKGEVEVLVSGYQVDVELPYPVEHRYKGLSFIFGKSGGIDIWGSFKKMNTLRLYREINKLEIEPYDLILNDFEPVSAWACRWKRKQCISLSHQSALLSSKVPLPNHSDVAGEFLLHHYAPCSHYYSFHFQAFDDFIYTPVIRSEIRQLTPTNEGHYTVYLPAYKENRLVEIFSKVPNSRWEVFSKHSKEAYSQNNVQVYPVNNEKFVQSMASSEGVLCGAGFETPAEALFLGKKLMVIPMKNQYEQQCNAAALKHMGVPVISTFTALTVERLIDWVKQGEPVQVDYPDITEQVIDGIIKKHVNG